MSQFYERQGQWQESYTWAEMGLWQSGTTAELPSDVSYRGELSLEFQKAVSAWWIGRKEESVAIFTKLWKLDIPDEYRIAIRSNAERMSLDLI